MQKYSFLFKYMNHGIIMLYTNDTVGYMQDDNNNISAGSGINQKRKRKTKADKYSESQCKSEGSK